MGAKGGQLARGRVHSAVAVPQPVLVGLPAAEVPGAPAGTA